jgi:addiction module HigA family antidote
MKLDDNPHPGEHIPDEMEALNMTQADLSRASGISRSRISRMLSGQRGISADTALRLSRWLGTPPEMWLRPQNLHDLRKAEAEAGEIIRQAVIPLHQPAGTR